MILVQVDSINRVIEIALRASRALWALKVSEATQKSNGYGKGDTFRIDDAPETQMRIAYKAFDPDVVFVTEETGAQTSYPYFPSDDRNNFPTTDISDPFDRSDPTLRFLAQISNQAQTLWELFSDPATKLKWEAEMGYPAEITGGCLAVTRVIKGVPIFSVFVNFVTRQLIVSCSAGIYCLDLPSKLEKVEKVNLAHVRAQGKRIYFPDINHHGNASRFVTFLKKKPDYLENFKITKLMEDHERATNLHFDEPGGPLRPFYLSTLHPDERRPGIVIANGEKLGEWAHWLTILRYGRRPNDDNEIALRMHEIFGDHSIFSGGVLMSPTPPYSLFRHLYAPEMSREPREGHILDVGYFPRFQVPSKIRSTLVLAPGDNEWLASRLLRHGYREIKM